MIHQGGRDKHKAISAFVIQTSRKLYTSQLEKMEDSSSNIQQDD